MDNIEVPFHFGARDSTPMAADEIKQVMGDINMQHGQSPSDG